MGFCAYCGNWVDEGDICSHCGSSGFDEDIEDDEENNQISTYDYFYRQAKDMLN